MKDVTQLYLDGEHFQKRASERDIPDSVMEHLLNFDINEWKLVTASVRNDRGKFVDSTWELTVDDVRYWITIGLGSFIITIVRKDCSGVENCVRGSEFYNFVEQVNRQLMDEAYDSFIADDFDTYFIARAKRLLAVIEGAMGKTVADKGAEHTIRQFGCSLEQ